jgi:hypothetical protein
VIEPDNLSAWVGPDAVWVRVDTPWRANWWRLVGDRLTVDDVNWDWVLVDQGLVRADADLTRMAVDKVRQALAVAR